MDIPNKIPNEANSRAAFDLWLFQRRISLGAACAGMGLNYEVVRRNMLPVNDKYFREASIATRKAVRKYTGGAVDLTDWPEAPDPQETPIGGAVLPPAERRQSPPEARVAQPSGASS